MPRPRTATRYWIGHNCRNGHDGEWVRQFGGFLCGLCRSMREKQKRKDRKAFCRRVMAQPGPGPVPNGT